MPSSIQMFTFLFLMLGPFKIIGPFVKITKNATPALTRQIALRATLFSVIALLLAGLLGESILAKYGIPVSILALSAGIILFLVALLNVIRQFEPHPQKNEAVQEPTLNMAINPLAFPSIVTPYGIAAVIAFLAISPEPGTKLTIGLMVLGIMILNLIFMLIAKNIFKPLSLILTLLGAILGVVQVALGLMIIINQTKAVLAL